MKGRTDQQFRYEQRRALINSIKIERGCVDCGFRAHPAALDFDHTDPAKKTWTIAGSFCRRWERVLEEIAKCDVRCANCHRIRTHTVDGASGLGTRADLPPSLFDGVVGTYAAGASA